MGRQSGVESAGQLIDTEYDDAINIISSIEVAGNCMLGRDYPINEVKEACFHAGLGEFLENTPQGLGL